MMLRAFGHWPSSHDLDLAFFQDEKTEQAIQHRAAALGLDLDDSDLRDLPVDLDDIRSSPRYERSSTSYWPATAPRWTSFSGMSAPGVCRMTTTGPLLVRAVLGKISRLGLMTLACVSRPSPRHLKRTEVRGS